MLNIQRNMVDIGEHGGNNKNSLAYISGHCGNNKDSLDDILDMLVMKDILEVILVDMVVMINILGMILRVSESVAILPSDGEAQNVLRGTILVK